MKSILISPHNDDETLFAAYTLQRHKPQVIVVTDSFIQYERGQTDITAHRRREETRQACRVLGLEPPVFLGLGDDGLERTIDALREYVFRRYADDTIMFVPACQGGNVQHDLIWNWLVMDPPLKYVEYATYANGEFYTPLAGGVELVPTEEEYQLKLKAIACYESQSWQGHVKAVIDARSEWVSRLPL